MKVRLHLPSIWRILWQNIRNPSRIWNLPKSNFPSKTCWNIQQVEILDLWQPTFFTVWLFVMQCKHFFWSSLGASTMLSHFLSCRFWEIQYFWEETTTQIYFRWWWQTKTKWKTFFFALFRNNPEPAVVEESELHKFPSGSARSRVHSGTKLPFRSGF